MVILIVEDDALLATTLAASLTDAGYDVVGPAATEPRAIQLAALMRPDLALVDISLRDGGSGVAVARALRAQGIPCLFVSGQSDAAQAARDAALGFLGKPYPPSAMLATLEVAKMLLAGRRPPPPPIPDGLVLF